MNKHSVISLLFAIACLLAFVCQAPIYLYSIAAFCYLALTAWGVFDIRLSYFLKTQYFLKGRPKKTVVLTFDDGPTELTSQFLDLLQQYNAKAIFFCVGEQIKKYPELIQRMHSEGHRIGNHTFSHQPKNTFSSTNLQNEIRRTDEVLEKLNIETTLFRPPYGVTNPPIARAIRAAQKETIGWDIRSLDTIIQNDDKLFRRIVRKLSNGNIILLHDKSTRTLRVLERLLQYLKENNFTITNNL